MASKASAAIALLLSLNLLFFSMANASLVDLDLSLSACTNVNVEVCVNSLEGGLLSGPLTTGCPCCGLIENLIAADAKVCLCAIVKANILDLVVVDLNARLKVLFDTCGLNPSKTYSC